jgi:hypothetical protein
LDSECGRYLFLSDFCPTENSNKFQKTRFWKVKSVEDVVTLGPMAQARLKYNFKVPETYCTGHEELWLQFRV